MLMARAGAKTTHQCPKFDWALLSKLPQEAPVSAGSDKLKNDKAASVSMADETLSEKTTIAGR